MIYRAWISSNLKTKVFQLVVPRNYVNSVLEEAHDSPSGGHFGVNKTLQNIRKRFYCVTICVTMHKLSLIVYYVPRT